MIKIFKSRYLIAAVLCLMVQTVHASPDDGDRPQRPPTAPCQSADSRYLPECDRFGTPYHGGSPEQWERLQDRRRVAPGLLECYRLATDQERRKCLLRFRELR